jgi:hypothetical protein
VRNIGLEIRVYCGGEGNRPRFDSEYPPLRHVSAVVRAVSLTLSRLSIPRGFKLTLTDRQDTVKCDRCQSFFHMGCVQPPLSAKPSRGYGWTCAPCSKRHEEEVDSHEVIRHSTPSNNKPKAPGRARGPGRPRKDRKLAEQEENAPIKHFGMWPFRYFG